MNKYKITDDSITIKIKHRKVTLHRIQALQDFSDVKIGDLGGWVEHEGNLSQSGSCWIYDQGAAFDNAKVFDLATVRDDAMVYNNAQVFGTAIVMHNAIASGNSVIHGNSLLTNKATVTDAATVCDSKILNEAFVYGNTSIEEGSFICSHTKIYANSSVRDSYVGGFSIIAGNAIVTKCTVGGTSEIYGDSVVEDTIVNNKILRGSNEQKSII